MIDEFYFIKNICAYADILKIHWNRWKMDKEGV